MQYKIYPETFHLFYTWLLLKPVAKSLMWPCEQSWARIEQTIISKRGGVTDPLSSNIDSHVFTIDNDLFFCVRHETERLYRCIMNLCSNDRTRAESVGFCTLLWHSGLFLEKQQIHFSIHHARTVKTRVEVILSVGSDQTMPFKSAKYCIDTQTCTYPPVRSLPPYFPWRYKPFSRMEDATRSHWNSWVQPLGPGSLGSQVWRQSSEIISIVWNGRRNELI